MFLGLWFVLSVYHVVIFFFHDVKLCGECLCFLVCVMLSLAIILHLLEIILPLLPFLLGCFVWYLVFVVSGWSLTTPSLPFLGLGNYSVIMNYSWCPRRGGLLSTSGFAEYFCSCTLRIA